jgi:hypothetical protein
VSSHNIVRSEAFQRAPFVYIRNVGGRRRRSGVAIAATAAVGASALAAMGFLAYALIQAGGVFF